MFNDNQDPLDDDLLLEDEEALKKAWQQPLQELFDALFAETEASPPVSIASLYRLSDMPEEYLAQFGRRWPTLSDERRPVIARHLADITEENYQVDFSPLCRIFLQDPLPAVRQAGLDALWDSSDTSLIQPIIHAMQQDTQLEVRSAAAATLGHYLLMVEWKQLPGRIKPPIEAALLDQLNQKELPMGVWRVALESFAASGHGRVPKFIERAYEDPDRDVQISAVFAMGRTADKRWLSTLLDELTSPNPAMRTQAAIAIGFLGSSDPVESLISMASEDDDLEVRLAAVTALGQIGGQTATQALNQLLEDPEREELHETITEALEEMMWLGGEIDWTLLDLVEDEDDEEDWLPDEEE
jgi:HEAT repeat protein